MAYFDYNRHHVESRQLFYQDFPRYYVFHADTKKWLPRRHGFTIGRLRFCPPSAGERYFLRLLLTVRAGCTSFEDLRTIEGEIHATFKAACAAMGLLEDDGVWVKTFDECSGSASGFALRGLFVTALTMGGLVDAPAIWNRYREHFCDDLAYRLLAMPDMSDLQRDGEALEHASFDYGLFLIRENLLQHGKSLDDFDLPAPTRQWEGREGNRLINAEVSYDTEREEAAANAAIAQLNEDQRACFDIIIDTLTANPEMAHFFLQGPAGTGKAFLYTTICHYLRAQGKIVLCVASSGIAALILPGGRTSHSRFKIPIDINDASLCSISKTSDLSRLLQRTSLIIWDEVPMQHKHCFEAVDRTLRDLRSRHDLLFGGVPVVLGGDFAQTLPIILRGSRGDIVRACLQSSPIWPRLRRLYLTRNMRVLTGEANVNFAAWLRNYYVITRSRSVAV